MKHSDRDTSLKSGQSGDAAASGAGATKKPGSRRLKAVLGSLCFLVLCVFVWQFVSYMLVPRIGASYGTDTYDSIPEDTVDVLFIGARSAWNGISPLTMWQQNGMTSYVFAALSCPPQVRYLELKDALDRQHPKLVFISPQFLASEDKEIQLRALQSMTNRKLTFNKALTGVYLEQDHGESIGVNALLPLLAYHDNWKNIDEANFVSEADGYYMGQRCWIFQNGRFYDTADDIAKRTNLDADRKYKRNEISAKYYRKMIELCKANGIQPILITLPIYKGFAGHAATSDFAKEEGVRYLDLNEPEYLRAIGLDNTVDWRDSIHLNFWGSVKFSKWLAALIETEYDPPDRRIVSDESFEIWHGHYSQFYERFSRIVPGALTPPDKVISGE